ATCYATTAIALSAATKKTIKGAATTKYIAKLAEYILHIHATATIAATAICRLCICCMAKLVVAPTFVGVTQYLVGFSSFFEVFFCLLITLIFIRMILDSHFTVGFLYLVGISTLRNT